MIVTPAPGARVRVRLAEEPARLERVVGVGEWVPSFCRKEAARRSPSRPEDEVSRHSVSQPALRLECWSLHASVTRGSGCRTGRGAKAQRTQIRTKRGGASRSWEEGADASTGDPGAGRRRDSGVENNEIRSWGQNAELSVGFSR